MDTDPPNGEGCRAVAPLRSAKPLPAQHLSPRAGLRAPGAPLVTAPFCSRYHIETARARREHRDVGARPGEGELLTDDRRLRFPAQALQALVVPVQAPDVAGMLTASAQGGVQL